MAPTSQRQFRTSHASRERNRVHARKTRQRKKEQMQNLQSRAEELKEEQLRLKQCINEKNTASILVGMFSTGGDKNSTVADAAANTEKKATTTSSTTTTTEAEAVTTTTAEDPLVEFLLRRPAEEIPDASKVTELPALILPGQHNSKKLKAPEATVPQGVLPDDGIDYQLLGKDRSKCSPEELDQIRRERNRMHAKRTRDRKRLFMEEMAEMCKKLEDENAILQKHLESLDGGAVQKSTAKDEDNKQQEEKSSKGGDNMPPLDQEEQQADRLVSQNGVTMNQLKTLLEAAGSFESQKNQMTTPGIMSLKAVASSVATANAVSNNPSSHTSDAEEQEGDNNKKSEPPKKRRRVGNKNNNVSPMAVAV